ncbi:MazG nucleotide pyrophosphohydrolase domain-containing protein [Corynebacterium antarcticum]|uniref:MazG nucleotide pyrophosphohydrolase domain-containing protein n=1 Tax=Corynebacterium antarcticum TaxID=2800405 RepID=UPI002260C008|nr:MazG nucleotide pyrophosphohydrolase domain-containing protein [Corynebacterium antarcticum]MCX7540678.1 nucleoside triphosphate hydrolase [Corynebacterium antarcticum]
MTVLLLDSASPTLVPAEVITAAAEAGDTVAFGESVPDSVRELVLGHGLRRGAPVAATIWVDTDPGSPEVLRRSAAGEEVSGPGASGIAAARAVMTRALDIGEWERGQDHVSLLPYLREEAEEFADAVRAHAEGAGTAVELRGELADVLLQVLFHAEIAALRGDFDLDDVADSFTSKLRRRAPYLFDGTRTTVPVEQQENLWQAAKNRGG